MRSHPTVIFFLALILSCGACTQTVPESIADHDGGVQRIDGDYADCGSDIAETPDAGPPCSRPTSGSIDELVRDVKEVEITVNLTDGFLGAYEEDRYRLRLSGDIGYLFYNDGSAVTVSAEQTYAIMKAIGTSSYAFNESCLTLAIDGGPYPPIIVVSNDIAGYRFTVSDASCAVSDHSRVGNAISCADYQGIMAELATALGNDDSFDCQDYW